MRISVICVTNRKGWSEVMADDLRRQDFQDFELVCAADPPAEEALGSFVPRPKLPGRAWNLNRAYNDCLDRATGELLVFLQDFIWIPGDGLSRFWKGHEEHPTAFITGVGHKAKDGLDGMSERDFRLDETKTGLHGCRFAEWEMNWACAPRRHMPRFEERMDEWYGGENQYVAKVAERRGCPMFIDQSNRCVAYSQEHCGGRPADWEDRHCWREGRLAAFLRYVDMTEGGGL